jgi:uncharacterized protein YxeA
MKKILFILLVVLISSCSPQMYFTGTAMRKFNTSQNKYTSKRPYVGKPQRAKYYSSGWRIWFIKK